jgi:hypothetical protein
VQKSSIKKGEQGMVSILAPARPSVKMVRGERWRAIVVLPFF